MKASLKLVGALVVIECGELGRIACVAKVDEADALHNTPAINIEARDNPFGKHTGIVPM